MKGRRITWFILWILSLVAISFYGGAVSYGLFFSLTLIPVISFVYLLFVFATFRIYQEIESRNIICRQSMPYYFVLHNGEQFAFASVSVRLFSELSYVEEMPEDVEYELLAGERYTFHTGLVCKYRGEYEVGVKEVIITDFFRLFRLRYKVPGTIKAVVYPRIIKKNELQSIRDISAYLCRESQSGSENADITVRDYVTGDSLRAVHWKASAKEQKLKVRNRVGEEKQGIVLLFDTGRYSTDLYKYLPAENLILETVLALGYFFAFNHVSFSAVYSQGEMRKSRVEGTGHYEAFYQEMAGILFDEREDGGKRLVQLAAEGSLWEAQAVFAVLQRLDEQVMETAESIAEGGGIVVLYVITDETLEQYERLNSSRLKVIRIPVDSQPEEWL